MKPIAQFRYLSAILMMAALAACAHNPYKYADTALDKAHVTLRSLEIVQTEALTIVNDASVPAAVKTAIRQASQAATTSATELGNATIEVEKIRTELAVGTTTADKLRIANDKLLDWVATVKKRIASIQSAMKEAK